MSQNCKITNISPGVSLISVLNNFKNFIQITKNNDNIKETKLDKNLNKQILVIDSLSKEIKKTEKELIQKRIYYANKIKNINSSSPSELDKFFSERYK